MTAEDTRSVRARCDYHFSGTGNRCQRDAGHKEGNHYWEASKEGEAALARAVQAEPAPQGKVTADFFLEHETKYTQNKQFWVWECACGAIEEEKFISWEECHIQTRRHWADALTTRPAGAGQGELRALVVSWRKQANYSLQTSQEREIHIAAAAELVCADILEAALSKLAARAGDEAIAQARLDEAKEWDTTAHYHISRWPELEWRKKRLAELEAALPAPASPAPTDSEDK